MPKTITHFYTLILYVIFIFGDCNDDTWFGVNNIIQERKNEF